MSDSNSLTVQPTQEPSVALMLQGALANIQSNDITPQHVDVLGKMMDLYERNQKAQAEREFAAAFAALQSEMPNVKAVKVVPNKDGSERYKFAPFEEIMRQAQPLLKLHRFAVTFDNSIENGRITATCTLLHASGHSRHSKFSSRIGSGPPGSSEAQADGSAATYAKRFALCHMLNIVVEHMDNDARVEDCETVTQKQADELRDWVDSTGSDPARFLEFAGAKTFEEIQASKLPTLHARLRRKEQGAK